MARLFHSARLDAETTDEGVLLKVRPAKVAGDLAQLGMCEHGCEIGAPLNSAQCFELGTHLLGRALTLDAIRDAIAKVNASVMLALRPEVEQRRQAGQSSAESLKP